MARSSYEEYFPECLRDVIKEVDNGLLGEPWAFKELTSSIANRNDYYLIGSDFRAYVEAQDRVDQVFGDQGTWLKMSIHTALRMDRFSSDRAIAEYASNIW